MTWFIASLMIVGLWLILRPKTAPKAKTNPDRELTTEEVQRKYANLKRLREESHKERLEARNRELAQRQKERETYPNTPKYRQLLNMVGGDKEAADRLASASGVEKAIEDLIRDRR